MNDVNPAVDAGGAKKSGAVLRNTLFLVGGQVAGVPLSILLSATMGRYLGATDFGYLYLATTLGNFAFMMMEWGHGGYMAAAVAQDRSSAGRFLGSTIAWRLLGTMLVSVALALLALVLGYAPAFRIVLFFTTLQCFLNSLRNALQDVARGFERLEITAYAQFGIQLLTVLAVVPALWLGGGLLSVLIAQLAIALVAALYAWNALRSVAKLKLARDKASIRQLFVNGWSFLIFGIVMALQPNIDAVFLSKLASPAVLGWQAAAQRLMGIINMPATALGSALYPTLARLYVADREEYKKTVTRSLQGTALLAIPATLGCALYRSLGVQLFGNHSFKPVEQNLLVLSSLVFLLYFSMPLSGAVLAAGRQRPFALVQTSCLVVSLVLDPLLIPWFQTHYGNGGLGVCVAGAVSEIAVLAGAIPLLPKGTINSRLFVSIAKGLVAGGAMTAVALALGHVTPFLSAPLALVAYFACLWVIGGIEPDQLDAVRGLVARKLRRRVAT